MRFEYDPDHKGHGYDTCEVCKKVSNDGAYKLNNDGAYKLNKDYHEPNCRVRDQGLGACTFTVGPLQVIAIREWGWNPFGRLTKQILEEQFPELVRVKGGK